MMNVSTMKDYLNAVKMLWLAVMVPLLCCSTVCYAGRTARTSIPFKGTASGGTLVFGDALNPNYVRSVSVNTSAGESAESVVNRLARAIADSNSIFDYSRAGKKVDRHAVAASMALGSTLRIKGFPGQWLLTGSETGLGIPKPPLFLTCCYDKQADKFRLRWRNPTGEYSDSDYIKINWHFKNYTAKGGSVGRRGTATSLTIERPADVNDLDLDVRLMVFRHDTAVDALIANAIPLCDNAMPSSLAAIRVTGNGYCQEETYGIPFFAGIAPNWAAWSSAGRADEAAFEQGDKYANLPVHMPVYYPKGILTKPFYQVIKAPPQGVVHGVYRKFLGLSPGHTYRLMACLSTLEMDSVTGEWSFSLHAAPSGPDGEDLTMQQLAGLAALPDGRSGPEAGQILSYGPSKTTKGAFMPKFSGESTLGGGEGAHITLPANVDTITVWVRFSCSDPNGKVGLSGLKLEDISAIPGAKTTEQILLEEQQQELELLELIEKASHQGTR